MKRVNLATVRGRRPTLIAAIAVLTAAGAVEARDEGYGYYRILDGAATRYGVTDEQRDVSANEPLLEGDRVTVASGSRLEVVLPDFSRMRLGEYSDVDFQRLRADDNRAEDYRIRVYEGDLQLTIDRQPGEFLLELDVASVYLLESGSYRLSTEVDRATVLVREGFAEILTEAGSTVVRAGEEVIVEGLDDPRVWVDEASRADDLERWADANERDAERSSRYVDDELGYAASDLDSEGEWLEVSGSYAWRPYSRPNWSRPYYSGYWYDTPYGIHWVSEYRWGWLTAHYGYWDFDSHFGWVWYPGAVYSPAWVHWYWGPSYVGWIPSGYYYRHYGYWGYNYYGYVGSGWYGPGYGSWAFCPRPYFGHRRQRVYYDGVEVVPRNGRGLEAGVITTDTRGVRRQHWNNADETELILTRNASRTRGGLTYRHPEDLPDAVSYVTRSANKLPIRGEADGRIGPPDQVAVNRNTADLDDRVAGGLVVSRNRPTAGGTGIESRPLGASGRSIDKQERSVQGASGRSAASTVTPIAGTSTRSVDRSRTAARDGSQRRIVLPESPSALSRGRSADSEREASRSAPRTSSVEQRDGWSIERRPQPARGSARSGSSREQSATPARSATDQPVRHQPTRPTYDAGERRARQPSATPRSTPTRRYDRPSSSPSRSSRAVSRGSSRSSSKASSSSGGRSGSSSSSSSRSSSSGSSGGKASSSRSRSGG